MLAGLDMKDVATKISRDIQLLPFRKPVSPQWGLILAKHHYHGIVWSLINLIKAEVLKKEVYPWGTSGYVLSSIFFIGSNPLRIVYTNYLNLLLMQIYHSYLSLQWDWWIIKETWLESSVDGYLPYPGAQACSYWLLRFF